MTQLDFTFARAEVLSPGEPGRPPQLDIASVPSSPSAAPSLSAAAISPASANAPSAAPVALRSVRLQIAVEQALRHRIGPKVMVQLTTNRSTVISFKERREVLYVRVHAIFGLAPPEVLEALAAFVSGSKSRRVARLIDEYVEKSRSIIRGAENADFLLQSQGEVHDLSRILGELNRAYFHEKIEARITWGKAIRNRRRRSIRMGSYCAEHKLIRIHPALDQSFVPEYFVAAVVFHEMLHELHGVQEGAGRRCVHTTAFQEDERTFEHYEKATRWERRHLNRLLRY